MVCQGCYIGCDLKNRPEALTKMIQCRTCNLKQTVASEFIDTPLHAMVSVMAAKPISILYTGILILPMTYV